MFNEKDIKKYIYTAVIEVIILTIFVIASVFLFSFEIVALNPWTFMLPLGGIFLTVNGFILLFVFNKCFEDEVEK